MASVIYENNKDIVGSWVVRTSLHVARFVRTAHSILLTSCYKPAADLLQAWRTLQPYRAADQQLYPTSFHGHFRNRPRSEYSIPFRQRAKPSPPKKFLDQSKQRSNRHLFSQHDNRHAHSNMGNLEAYFGMGLGRRKTNSPQCTKNTRDLLTWSDQMEPLVSTYRSQFSLRSTPSELCNSTEPLHIRGNVSTERRQLRMRSLPPARAQTAPLLAWNSTDEFLNVKPLVGCRSNRYAEHTASQKSMYSVASISPNHNPLNQSIMAQGTVMPLNNTV